jgi:hypothetical protein
LDTSYFDEHFESIEEILQYLTFALWSEFKDKTLNKEETFKAVRNYFSEIEWIKYNTEIDALEKWDFDYEWPFKDDIFNDFWKNNQKVVEVCDSRASILGRVSEESNKIINEKVDSIIKIIK